MRNRLTLKWFPVLLVLVAHGNAQPTRGPPKEIKTRSSPKQTKFTSLHTFALSSEYDLDRFDELVASGLDIEERDSSGHTLLMTASMTGVDSLVKKLLESGADPLARDPQGNTALHMVASVNQEGALRELILAGGRKTVDATNLMGSTPLHYAAKAGQPDMVYQLINFGANVQARDRSGQTAMDEARAAATQRPGNDQGHQQAIKLLQTAPTADELRRKVERELSDAKGGRKRRKKKRRRSQRDDKTEL